jgi:hypothetical protein
VATTLTGPYLNKGYSLFTGNWYTSPSSFLFVYNLKPSVVQQKSYNPVSQKLSSGEVQSMISDSLMVMMECDRHDVRMLFTIQMKL